MSTPSQLSPAIFLMGPTATGKTDIAIRLLQDLPCEIISVDSALIYRQMDIGTAKPGVQTLAEAPHRLINIIDPRQSYSAAEFRDDALREMAEITAMGRIPLLVGGTMLYYRTLQYGLSDLPSADAQVRKYLEQQAARLGWEAMHRRLQQVDPTAAARIHPNDPQRVQRALEVYEIAGRSMTELIAAQQSQEIPYRLIKLGLMPEDRSQLHVRIEQRFDQMLQAGFVTEVERLRQRGDLNLQLPSMRAVGYRQVWEYLDGKYGRETMRHKGVVATRQLAKRQITWLRSEKDISLVEPFGDLVYQKVLKFLAGARI